MDNHSAHKTLLTKRVLEEMFTPMYQPAHSCRFNSIESKTISLFIRNVNLVMWGLGKTEMRKKMLGLTDNITRLEFAKLVQTTMEEVGAKHMDRVTRAN